MKDICELKYKTKHFKSKHSENRGGKWPMFYNIFRTFMLNAEFSNAEIHIKKWFYDSC